MGLLLRILKPITVMVSILLPAIFLPNIIRKARCTGPEPHKNKEYSHTVTAKKVPPHKEQRVLKTEPAASASSPAASRAQNAPPYIGNARSKEIHDVKNAKPACQIKRMSEKNKIYFNTYEEAQKAIETNGYNGCKWCFINHKTD